MKIRLSPVPREAVNAGWRVCGPGAVSLCGAFRASQLADPRLAGIPVVVCSAEGDLAGRTALLRAAALLSKPVEFADLAEAVRSLAGPGVLVVDAEPHVRRVLELALTREGL